MGKPPVIVTAETLRDLLDQIIGAYDELVAAELARPQRVAVLEAMRSELKECIEEAAEIIGARRRR